MDTGKKRTEELISNRHRGKRRDKEEEIIKQQESGCRWMQKSKHLCFFFTPIRNVLAHMLYSYYSYTTQLFIYEWMNEWNRFPWMIGLMMPSPLQMALRLMFLDGLNHFLSGLNSLLMGMIIIYFFFSKMNWDGPSITEPFCWLVWFFFFFHIVHLMSKLKRIMTNIYTIDYKRRNFLDHIFWVLLWEK